MEPIFIDFWCFWVPFWIVFFAGSPFSPFPKYLPTNTDSPVSPQGCGGQRSALTMTFEVLFASDVQCFSKMAKVLNKMRARLSSHTNF